MITYDQLKALTGKNDVVCSKYITGINNTLAYADINTPLRVCHFFAQILHESGCLRYTVEGASGNEYEGRADLGNTQAGDGVRFKGRGLIQITGRSNYKQFTDAVSYPEKYNFITNPQLLQEPFWATLSAGWYWKVWNLNKIADQDDIKHVTLHVNGGYNGLDQRIAYLNKAKKIFMPTVQPISTNSNTTKP